MAIKEDMVLESSPVFSAESLEEDRRLIQAAKRDVNAFGALYDKYYNAISGYIYHRTLDRALTEDLTANTFFSAFRHIGRFRWQGVSFGAWLYRIASNEIKKHYRKQGRSPLSGLEAESKQAQFQATSIQIQRSLAGEKLLAAEELSRLHQAVLSLKPMYQTVRGILWMAGRGHLSRQ